MASSQDSLASFLASDIPATPEPSHASLPSNNHASLAQISTMQSNRVDKATTDLTPPPSSQLAPSTSHSKARTPTPTFSHISTPPPTVESSQTHSRSTSKHIANLTLEEIESASPDVLRAKVAELQASLQEAKTSAAHHKLQYQMLSQESTASIERMAVEARMAQYENDVIHNAEQAKSNVSGIRSTIGMQDGMIPVEKELYQSMCSEIQRLRNTVQWTEHELVRQQRTITLQENEISTLDDKVLILRERIRENRDTLNKYRRVSGGPYLDASSTSHSLYTTPRRSRQDQQHPYSGQDSSQPFAALLQASEMAASQQAASRRPSAVGKKAHIRNTHSLSSLPPVTPQRGQRHSTFYTPQQPRPGSEAGRFLSGLATAAATAPQPRSNAIKSTLGVYTQSSIRRIPGPGSDGTLSASDRDADSEAETDIISPSAAADENEVSASQASTAAAQMLRSEDYLSNSQESRKGDGLKQTRLFGAVVKKRNFAHDENDEPLAKKRHAIGLGIQGVQN
ncbi:Hypothetical protein R9X50_00480600 [Acrodontium crateriforme]|uniref:FAD-dependent oxidoreductase-like enzyme n=1 Tax=Acrodontium crateriforme TaxID=150365 RepID=A0AAQ3MBM3_9PEZI|nr:Hypothetical protein R9X50_00480600 [Acrodontium crateriforme]